MKNVVGSNSQISFVQEPSIVDRVFWRNMVDVRERLWEKQTIDWERTDQLVKFGDVPINGLGDCFIMWKLSKLKKVKDPPSIPSSDKLMSVHPFPSLSKLEASSVCLIYFLKIALLKFCLLSKKLLKAKEQWWKESSVHWTTHPLPQDVELGSLDILNLPLPQDVELGSLEI